MATATDRDYASKGWLKPRPTLLEKIVDALLLLAAGAVLAGLCLAFFSAEVMADELKVNAAVGQGVYQPSPPGMWWQPDQNNQNVYRDNNSFELGVSGKLNHAFGWSVRYVNLGRAHTRATAITTPNDSGQRDLSKDTTRADCKQAFSEDNCLYHWSGDGGSSPGINISFSAEILKLGALSLEGELGAYLYRMKWSEQVCPSDCQTNEAWRVTIEQKTGYYISPMAGLTASVQVLKDVSVFVASRLYMRTSQHMPISAGVAGPAQTWLTGISVSF